METFNIFSEGKINSKDYPALSAFLNQPAEPLKDNADILCKVSGVRVSNSGLNTQTLANFNEKMPLIMTNIKLQDKKSNITIQSFNSFDKDCYLSETVNTHSATAQKLAKENNLRCMATFVSLDSKGQKHQREYVYDSDGFYLEDPTVLQTNCTAPRAKNKKQTIISYLRDSIKPDYDYSYPNAVVQNGVINIHVPFAGSCKVHELFNIESIKTQPDFLQLTFNTGAPCTYNNSKGAGQFKIDKGANTVSWDFDDDWNTVQDLRAFGPSTVVGLVCNFTLVLSFKDKPEIPLETSVTVTSVQSEDVGDSGATAYIEQILLQWGCFAMDTLITMADGSDKAICDIKIGEMVRKDTDIFAVTNVYYGFEEKLVVIATSKGKRIRVTGTHPIVTKNGNVRAIDLNASDLIKTLDGFESITDLYMENYNSKVYNLDFDEPTMIIANGIYAGDFYLQNTTDILKSAQAHPADILKIQQEAEEFFLKQ
jgi:hypothetical protein